MSEIQVRPQPAEVRHAINSDRQGATPVVVDPDVRKLGEDLQHVWPHEILDVARETGTVILAAAEQQPVIVGETKVIDHETRVVHAETAVDQFPRTFPAEGFRRDHEIVDRHDPAGNASLEPTEIAVACQDDERRPHVAVPGLDVGRVLARIPSHLRILVDPDAGLARRTRKSQHVVKRVQDHGLGVPEPAEKGRRCDQLPDLGFVERLAVRVVVALGKRVGEFVRPVAVAFLVNADDLAFLQVALDLVLPDAAADLFLCGLARYYL